MAVLIVDDVAEVHDLVELINYLVGALASGHTDELLGDGTFTLTRSATPTPAQLHDLVRLDEDEACIDPLHMIGCRCVEDAISTDPRQGILVDSPRHQGPIPFVPCTDRGRHERLTECWMCWSDVHRGAISIEQALSAGPQVPRRGR